MCLYPKLILNRKYLPNKKNNGQPPVMKDPRIGWVPIGCQKCIECQKQRARQWQVRLNEEIKQHKYGHKHFITLTFSNQAISELAQQFPDLTGYELDNQIATQAVRYFLERWRAKYKTSIKHWLITELGHNGTENIHLHGILFTNKPHDIEKIWKYGYVWIGTYVSAATVNYTIKYCTKQDQQHKYYNPKILTSPGIGANYFKTTNASLNKYKPSATKETYTNQQGYKINLPIYYRNHIYTEQQRESLWIEKLDKQIRYVDGSKIDVSKSYEQYYEHLKWARSKSTRLGYGNDQIDWDRKQYEQQLRQMNQEKRIANQIYESP